MNNNENIKYIPLTQGKFAIVDADDFDNLMQFKWQIGWGKHGKYARRKIVKDGKKSCEFMHRRIAQTPNNLKTDHINGDTLDNRKANLRICTNAENCRNQKKASNKSSVYKGVSWHKGTGMWQARITVNRKTIHLGIWQTEKEAAIAYDNAAPKIHDVFLRKNF